MKMKMNAGDTKQRVPRRAMSAYNYYFHRNKLELQAHFTQQEGRKPSFKELAREVGKRWKLVLPHEKAQFEKLAAEDKRRYGLEIVAFRMDEETTGVSWLDAKDRDLNEEGNSAKHAPKTQDNEKWKCQQSMPNMDAVKDLQQLKDSTCEPSSKEAHATQRLGTLREKEHVRDYPLTSLPTCSMPLPTTFSNTVRSSNTAHLYLPQQGISATMGSMSAHVPSPVQGSKASEPWMSASAPMFRPHNFHDDNESFNLFADDGDVRFLEETFGFGSEQFSNFTF